MAIVSSGKEMRLVIGDSPEDVRSKTQEMMAHGYSPSVILWSDIAEAWYEWWYLNPDDAAEAVKAASKQGKSFGKVNG